METFVVSLLIFLFVCCLIYTPFFVAFTVVPYVHRKIQYRKYKTPKGYECSNHKFVATFDGEYYIV